MTVKLSTTINNIERDVLNSENKQLLVQFLSLWKELVLQKNIKIITWKALIAYSKSLEPTISFYEIKDKNQIKQKRM
jgi:hypothetical protein